ncbi:MAG TPA: serine/threonine protein kinase [Steroidobacteraceae bacterium]|jgi:Ser/Thr protein kinase RdoA (MazF antagonist)|nr:serine/threonine protein kinase [Steroidobacteraceae bacterium]
MNDQTPYSELSPEAVLDAIEAVGYRCDGRVLALNSYENRVYQIGIEDGAPVVAKFYRPARWTDAAIREEHAFACELAAQEIPVVAPLVREGATLHVHHGFRYAVFPRRGGRWPELGTSDDREWVGRFLGRIHAVGRAARFHERARLSVEVLGRQSRDFVLEGDWMPDYLATKYADVTDEMLDEVEARAEGWRGAVLGRILGDCHRGNILWTEQGPHFVDLDDCLTGPAIQDLWMLLAGGREEMRTQLGDLLKGYEQFLPFDRSEIALIEPLRALRMIHYSAWLARRWHDPAFPRAFPWFAEPRYWEQHHRSLEEQLAAVMDEPLEL